MPHKHQASANNGRQAGPVNRIITAVTAAVLAWPSSVPAQDVVPPTMRPADLAALAPATPPDTATPVALPQSPTLGTETNLPLPRFVSLKTDEGNVRRGPSLSHRIDWVFVREDMPLMITAEYGHWRRVVDRDGLGGWVHYSLLSGSRSVIVDADLAPLRAQATDNAREVALLEAGVIARIDECGPSWCRVTAGGYRGWLPKTALWGVGADEILD
jgi:SH3-like domain-containing protein